nr:polysaccharide biosynthesis/export family protein [Paraburkholderia mimosarum]
MLPSVAAVLVVTGCTTVPRLQMPSAATQSTHQNVAPPPVAIQEIDAGLIEAQQTARTDLERTVAKQLLGAGPSGYRIGRGDVLQIVVWDHPEFALGQGRQPAVQPRQADAPGGTVVDGTVTLAR